MNLRKTFDWQDCVVLVFGLNTEFKPKHMVYIMFFCTANLFFIDSLESGPSSHHKNSDYFI